jgi:hypothetical protein
MMVSKRSQTLINVNICGNLEDAVGIVTGLPAALEAADLFPLQNSHTASDPHSASRSTGTGVLPRNTMIWT